MRDFHLRSLSLVDLGVRDDDVLVGAQSRISCLLLWPVISWILAAASNL